MPTNPKRFFLATRVESDLNTEFEDWRRAQRPEIPTKTDGVQYLLKCGLRSEARRKQSKPETTTTA
jgi:hypothetical protein